MEFARKLKNTLMRTTVIRIGSVGLDLLFFGYILKRLPVDEVGLYNWVIAVLAFGALFLDMGLNQVLIREINLGKQVANSIRGAFKLRIPVVGLGFLVFGGWYLYGGSTNTVYFAVLYAALVTLGNYFCNILMAYLWAVERQTVSSLLIAQNSLLRLVAGLVVIESLGYTDAVDLLAGLVAAKVLSIAVVVAVYLHYRRAYPEEGAGDAEYDFRAYALASFTYLGIGVVNTVRQRADWLLIETWLDKAALANYALANKVFELSMMMWIMGLVIFYPWQCRMLKDGVVTDKYRLFFGLGVLLALVSGFLLYVSAPFLIELVYADKFEMSVLPTKVLAVALIFSVVEHLLATLIIAKGLARALFYMGLAAVTIQIALDVLLIPKYGLTGAAVAMLASYVAAAIIHFHVSGRNGLVGFGDGLKALPAVMVMTLGFGASQFLYNPALQMLVITVTAIVAIFEVYLRGDDREYVLRVLKGRSG